MKEMIPLIFVIFWSALVGFFASRRRRNPYGWFFLSLIITPLISAITLHFLKDLSKRVKLPCPSCAQLVSSWDSTCEHCKYSLATDELFVANAKKAQNMSSDEVAEKKRIAGEGYEAFIAGLQRIENPYRSTQVETENANHISYWDRGFNLAETRKSSGDL